MNKARLKICTVSYKRNSRTYKHVPNHYRPHEIKKLADALNKFEATAEEAKRVFKVLSKT